MENEYIIVNKSAIEKDIADLEIFRKFGSGDDNDYYIGQIKSLKQVLSQSIPLIPEIEKAWVAGAMTWSTLNAKQDYIDNLNLEI